MSFLGFFEYIFLFAFFFWRKDLRTSEYRRAASIETNMFCQLLLLCRILFTRAKKKKKDLYTVVYLIYEHVRIFTYKTRNLIFFGVVRTFWSM